MFIFINKDYYIIKKLKYNSNLKNKIKKPKKPKKK